MARRPTIQRPKRLSVAVIAAAFALFALVNGVSSNRVADELKDVLTQPYQSLLWWGVFAVSSIDTVVAAIWALRQQQAEPGSDTGPIGYEDIRDSNVAGRDVNISYQAPPTTPSALHQIPPPPGDFTGRTRELADLLGKIQQGGAAISGLRGMGGIGKTALARKLAQELASDYPDAQIEVNLRGLDPQSLSPADAMAHVIRSFNREARLPEGEAELGALYRSMLHGQRALLLLDNAASREQVLPLIPPQGCLLLVTSRQRFDLPGLFALDLDTLPPQEARELLLNIEPRIGGEADAIARLCGYLPLALRVAATALKVRVDLTPAEYRRRLAEARKLFPEVDASFSLSYDLLAPELQRRWRALAVFPGPFALIAAAAVWELELDPAQDTLGRLLTYSLVEWDPDRQRYRLHDLARQFADARLGDAERAAARRRHAAHFRDFLAEADRLNLEGGDKLMQGLALFDLEWGNIRAGQAWAAEHAEEDDAAAALCSDYPNAGADVLELHLHPRERIPWLELALAAARRLADRQAESAHLGNLGVAFWQLGEARRAIEYYQQALAIDRETGDRRGEGNALGNLGVAYRQLGEVRRAIEHYELALVVHQETGHRRGEGNALDNLGSGYLSLGDARGAIEHYELAVVVHQETGDRRGEGNALDNLGSAYLSLGEARRAIKYHEQALEICRETGYRRGEGNALDDLGSAYIALRKPRRAIEYHQQALTISRETGDRREGGAALGNLGSAYTTLRKPRRAIEYHQLALVILREVGDRRGEGKNLWNLAVALDHLGERAQAIAHAEAALQIFEEIEDPNAARVREALARWRMSKPPFAARLRQRISRWRGQGDGEGESPPY